MSVSPGDLYPHERLEHEHPEKSGVLASEHRSGGVGGAIAPIATRWTGVLDLAA